MHYVFTCIAIVAAAWVFYETIIHRIALLKLAKISLDHEKRIIVQEKNSRER